MFPSSAWPDLTSFRIEFPVAAAAECRPHPGYSRSILVCLYSFGHEGGSPERLECSPRWIDHQAWFVIFSLQQVSQNSHTCTSAWFIIAFLPALLSLRAVAAVARRLAYNRHIHVQRAHHGHDDDKRRDDAREVQPQNHQAARDSKPREPAFGVG